MNMEQAQIINQVEHESLVSRTAYEGSLADQSNLSTQDNQIFKGVQVPLTEEQLPELELAHAKHGGSPSHAHKTNHECDSWEAAGYGAWARQYFGASPAQYFGTNKPCEYYGTTPREFFGTSPRSYYGF